MSVANPFYIVPMVRQFQPVSPIWNLMHYRQPWMDADGWMDEVFGDFVGFIPSKNDNATEIIADNNKDGLQGSQKDFLMVLDNKKHESENNFRVQLDVSQFTPEEINVRVVGRDLVIDGKHEEREDDHGFISRSFTRRYALPEDVDVMKVEGQLSKDGKLLKLEAPKKEAIEHTPQEAVWH